MRYLLLLCRCWLFHATASIYYEPGSATFLTAETFLVAQTKCSAVKYLLENYNLKLREKAERKIDKYLESNKNNGPWERGELKPDLIYTPLEMYEQLGFDKSAKHMIQYPLYAGATLSLYAKEDLFDESR